MTKTIWRAIATSLVCGLGVSSVSAQPLSSAFTYQGEISSGTSPANGTYDLRFRLHDSATRAFQVGSTLCVDNVSVVNGRFAVSLDFGAVYNGQPRFLAIEVRQDTGLDCSDATGFTLLSPRQELTAAPTASFALTAGSATTAANATSLNGQSPSYYQNAANLTGTIADARLTNNVARLDGNQTFTGLLNFTNPANIFNGSFNGAATGSFNGTFSGNGAGLTNLNGAGLSAGSVARSALSADVQGGLATRLGDWSTTPYQQLGSAATGIEPRSIAVSGAYAYVASSYSGQLQVYNINNPLAPTLVGSIDVGGSAYSVAVSGSYAFVANANFGQSALQVYNISNPAAPVLAGSVNTAGIPLFVAVSGSYAYIADVAFNTLKVYNISNPASPTLVGSVATGLDPRSIAISGSYAYVVNLGADTLQVFNISNPAAPTLAATVATAGQPFSVAVAGSSAYVVNIGRRTLQVFDISNPATPVSVGSVGAGGNPLSVAVSGSYAFVADTGSSTLKVFNVSTPSSPTLAGSVAAANPYSVAVSGLYAYVGNFGTNTLQIVSPLVQVDFGAPISASSLAGVNGSGLTNVVPVSSWASSALNPNSIVSGGGFYSTVDGTSQPASMRQGVAVVSWSTSAFTNTAASKFSVRVKAVTNGVTTLGVASVFTFSQANVHSTISGNAVITIPSSASTTFSLEVSRLSGSGAFKTDSDDAFTATIINMAQ